MPAVFHSSAPAAAPPLPKSIILLSTGEQVAAATDDTLHRALITADGCGASLKSRALDELLRRSDERGYRRGSERNGLV